MEKVSVPYKKVLLVCLNEREPGVPACGTRGSQEILRALKDYVKAHNLKRSVRVAGSGCLDLCGFGPNVFVLPEGVWYKGVAKSDVERIVEEQLRPLEGASA
jgi:(2Fe-2S) ferredoxin